MNRQDFQDLAEVRLNEARALFANKLFAGAYYLAGYAVECALKACIARRTREFDFPDKNAGKYYTHKITELGLAAEVSQHRAEAAKSDAEFEKNWKLVTEWTEESRYARTSEQSARDLIQAVEHPTSGVLQWLKLYW